MKTQTVGGLHQESKLEFAFATLENTSGLNGVTLTTGLLLDCLQGGLFLFL